MNTLADQEVDRVECLCNGLGEKPRFAREIGMRVAAELCRALRPECIKIIVAGSLRRRKNDIGDIEILYIGRTGVRQKAGDMFEEEEFDRADAKILELELAEVIGRRLNVKGFETYGPKIKLVKHLETGLPVDLFKATADNWFNYLVCRTGPAASNINIAKRAQERGAHWMPFGSGFRRGGQLIPVESEAAVFEFVGLPYREPWERE